MNKTQATDSHSKDTCLICKGITNAITDPIMRQLQEFVALNKTAPYGRCSLCNLALTEREMHYYGDMHLNCAEDHYE